MGRKIWIKEPWSLTLPKDTTSPTDSVYKTHDILIQSCVLSRIDGSRVLHSAGPFSVRYKSKSGRIYEKSAELK